MSHFGRELFPHGKCGRATLRKIQHTEAAEALENHPLDIFFENLHIFIFKLFTEFHVMHTLPLNVLVFAYFDANSMTACCAALGFADFDSDIHSSCNDTHDV